MSSPSDRAAHLSPEEKRGLLARLLRTRGAAAGSPCPLSHGQRALWFLHQLAPGSGPTTSRLCGASAPSSTCSPCGGLSRR